MRAVNESFFLGWLKVALKKISAGLRPVRAMRPNAFLEVTVAGDSAMTTKRCDDLLRAAPPVVLRLRFNPRDVRKDQKCVVFPKMLIAH